jgi:hypothetical protein
MWRCLISMPFSTGSSNPYYSNGDAGRNDTFEHAADVSITCQVHRFTRAFCPFAAAV